MSLKDTEDKPTNFWDNAINFCRESWKETIRFIRDLAPREERMLEVGFRSWKEHREKRFQLLCVAVVAGIVLAFLFYLILSCWLGIDSRLSSGLILLILSLPTLTILWTFRTHDTREQIKKTQENINVNLLSNGLNMLTSDNLRYRCMGLVQLAQLRQRGLFEGQIDLATAHTDFSQKRDHRNQPVENCANLPGADLQYMDLSGANLHKANLHGAKLEHAILSGANLSGAELGKV